MPLSILFYNSHTFSYNNIRLSCGRVRTLHRKIASELAVVDGKDAVSPDHAGEIAIHGLIGPDDHVLRAVDVMAHIVRKHGGVGIDKHQTGLVIQIAYREGVKPHVRVQTAVEQQRFGDERPADAVVINLGTNDFSGLEKLFGRAEAGFAALEDSAEVLLALVRKRNPGAKILWAYGLCGAGASEPLKRAVARRIAGGDGNVRYLALTDCGDDLGSRGHPGRHAQARAARQIADCLENWQ